MNKVVRGAMRAQIVKCAGCLVRTQLRSAEAKTHNTTVVYIHQYQCNLRTSFISVLKCYFPNRTRV